MVTHRERWPLAETICGKMVARYGDEVLLGAVYGSSARDEDTAWSDLEMQFVVQPSSRAISTDLLYRGTAVGIHVIDAERLETHLRTPTLRWPYWMGVLSTLQILRGDSAQVTGWLELGRSVPQARFHDLLEASAAGLVVESYGRVHSCKARNNRQDVGCAVVETLLEMNLALCLLNRRWVTHDYFEGLCDAFEFPKLPKDYSRLASALWQARDPDEIVALADELVENYWALLEREGIRIQNAQVISDLLPCHA
jgi:kanamycin nucleotidyltransferase